MKAMKSKNIRTQNIIVIVSRGLAFLILSLKR